jgi:hypothetical protein
MRQIARRIALFLCFTLSLAVLSNIVQAQTFTVLHTFTGADGRLPQAPLTMDSQGNLYGETYGDGAYGYGSVFKVTRSGDGWLYTDLHDFTNRSDGANPIGQILLDGNGNLYGTASEGGSTRGGGYGTVWEITP